MRQVHRLFEIRPVKKREHFIFNLLNFRFFKNSDNRQALFLRKPHLISNLIIVPYILASEIMFLRGTRFFVKFEKQVVGIFVLREKPEALYIGSLAVSPEHRRFGIATYVLDYTGRVGKRMGKKWLELLVLKANEPALRLYKKAGFAEKENRKRSFILRRRI